MSIENRDQLTAAVVGVGHDTQQTDRCNDLFIPAAEARIGSELKSEENAETKTITLTDGVGDVPADYGSYHRVFIGTPHNGRDVNHFEIFAGKLYAAETEIELWYWAQPAALESGEQTNAVLDRWPNLYMYATLLELQIWKQDSEQIVLANEAYADEVARINRQARWARGGKPQSRRA